jgi:hypothetical protein
VILSVTARRDLFAAGFVPKQKPAAKRLEKNSCKMKKI